MDRYLRKLNTAAAKPGVSHSDSWKALRLLWSMLCGASADASFQPGGRIAMKGKITQTPSRTRVKGDTDLKRLRAMRDDEINFSDIPKLGKSFWKTARIAMPEPKDRLTIRVDHDVVQWLKKNGRGYQTRINAILRSYMEAQTR
jgi:uncharacterized protein (DUF4415 family)